MQACQRRRSGNGYSCVPSLSAPPAPGSVERLRRQACEVAGNPAPVRPGGGFFAPSNCPIRTVPEAPSGPRSRRTGSLCMRHSTPPSLSGVVSCATPKGSGPSSWRPVFSADMDQGRPHERMKASTAWQPCGQTMSGWMSSSARPSPGAPMAARLSRLRELPIRRGGSSSATHETGPCPHPLSEALPGARSQGRRDARPSSGCRPIRRSRGN